MTLPADAPKPTPPAAEARRRTLVASLRTRYGKALKQRDPAACRALFREAVYLGIPFAELETAADPDHPA